MNERRKRRRRGRHSFLLAVFGVFALIFAFILTGSLFFKIKDIEVEGALSVSKSEIVAASGFSIGENIFLINKSAAYRSIRSKLPYVHTVRVKREWPGKVVIIITEAAPAAMIEHRGIYWLFDIYGSLLETAPSYSLPNLPIVKGIGLLDPLEGTKLYPAFGDETKDGPLLALLKAMQEEGIWEDVDEIDLSQISNICFTYRGIYRIEMGLPEAVVKKLRTLLMALEDEKVVNRGGGTFYLAPAGEDKPVSFIPGGG